MSLVGVCVLLFHVKLVHLVHAFDFALRPDSFVVICFQFGTGRHKPPKKIDAEGKLGVVEKVLLLSILLLQVVNVALIVIDRSDLLREEIKGEVGEQEPFHEGENAPDESIGVVLYTENERDGLWTWINIRFMVVVCAYPVVHVETSVLARQQVVERHDAEEGKDRGRKHDVQHELEEVLHVLLTDTVIHPRTVMVHFKDAETTLTAVVGPGRLPSFFTKALGAVFNLIVLALEGRSEAFRDATWVRKGSPQVAHIGHEAEAIESNSPEEAFKC